MTHGSVLVRRLDVTTRPPDEILSMVEHGEGGLLLERFVGRYVLNADARKVWLLLDGRRTVDEIAKEIAPSAGDSAATARAVMDLCRRLLEIELVEDVSAVIASGPNPAELIR